MILVTTTSLAGEAIISSSQSPLTNNHWVYPRHYCLDMELWADSTSSAAAAYTVTSGAITVPTIQVFSEGKLSEVRSTCRRL